MALNRHTHRTTLDDSWGASGPANCDVFEDGYFYLPELLISQGFLDGQLVIMGGMINQTNYFDANTYANTTFGQFGGAPFDHNQVLPLGDSNFGFVGQYQFNDNWFVQIGGNMMDNEPRRNPFHNTTGKSFNLLGEIGWTHEKCLRHRHRHLIVCSPSCSTRMARITVAWRSTWNRTWAAARSPCLPEPGGAVRNQATSAGRKPGFRRVVFKKPLEVMTGMKEADGNFFGIGFSVSKPDSDTLAETRPGHDREMILECTYSFSITPYCLIQPSYQYVKNPSGGMTSIPPIYFPFSVYSPSMLPDRTPVKSR